MELFGVKIVMCIIGTIKTNIFFNAPKHKLPPNSLYFPTQKQISKKAYGENVKSHSTPSNFAKILVGDTLNGASGLIYRGNMFITVC